MQWTIQILHIVQWNINICTFHKHARELTGFAQHTRECIDFVEHAMELSQYRRYFLFRTIRVEYSFESSLMMLRKDETVGTYATGGIASLRSKCTGPGIRKTYV